MLVIAAPARAADPFVYVASPLGNQLFQDGADDFGALTPLAPPTVSAGPRPFDVAVSADGQSVYAVGIGGVSQYDVGDDGTLSPKLTPTVAAGATPTSVAVSPDNRSAYVANLGSGTISQYNIGPGGALFPKRVATVALEPNLSPNLPTFPLPVAVAISPDGKSVYVTSVPVANLTGTGAVYQFDVQVGGLLSPMSPAEVPTGNQPQGLAVNPDSKSVYVLNQASDTISQYDVGTDGTLSSKDAGPIGAGDAPGNIAVSPDGLSAYVANFGDPALGGGSVTQYNIASDGSLTSKQPEMVLAGQNPYGVAVSPDGQSVYVTDFGSRSTGNGTLYQFDLGLHARLVPKDPPSLPLGAGANGGAVAVSPVLATSGDDVLTGTAADNVICGLGGSDTIKGLGGNDTLFGDRCGSRAGAAAATRAGDDVLYGGTGRDRLYGGAGRDRLYGGAGQDRLNGGEGRDRLESGAGNDRLDGGAGNDRIYGGGGRDRISGGAGRDRLDGGPGNDTIDVRGGGRDYVQCGTGRDTVRADPGDTVRRCERVLRRRPAARSS